MTNRKPSAATILCKALPVTAILAASAFAAGTARAATPAAAFDYATMVGAGNTIHVDRVPIISSGGNVIYKDVQLTFRITPIPQATRRCPTPPPPSPRPPP
jgi:hypothetical protein